MVIFYKQRLNPTYHHAIELRLMINYTRTPRTVLHQLALLLYHMFNIAVCHFMTQKFFMSPIYKTISICGGGLRVTFKNVTVKRKTLNRGFELICLRALMNEHRYTRILIMRPGHYYYKNIMLIFKRFQHAPQLHTEFIRTLPLYK